jgi:hypothetical protein
MRLYVLSNINTVDMIIWTTSARIPFLDVNLWNDQFVKWPKAYIVTNLELSMKQNLISYVFLQHKQMKVLGD